MVRKSSHSFLPLPINLVIHPTSLIKKLLLEAVGCWKYRWEHKEPSPCLSTASQSVGKAGLETKIHYNCAKCHKGWDQSPVAKSGLGVGGWDIYVEYLRMRRIMSWEVGERWTERGNVLLQVEQGMCWKAGQEGAESWLLDAKGSCQGQRHCDVHSGLLCT